MNKLDEMAQRLNDAVFNPEAAEEVLRALGAEIDELARRAEDVPLEIVLEDKEDDPKYAAYWRTVSTMWAQVYSAAAIGLTYYKELHEEVKD